MMEQALQRSPAATNSGSDMSALAGKVDKLTSIQEEMVASHKVGHVELHHHLQPGGTHAPGQGRVNAACLKAALQTAVAEVACCPASVHCTSDGGSTGATAKQCARRGHSSSMPETSAPWRAQLPKSLLLAADDGAGSAEEACRHTQWHRHERPGWQGGQADQHPGGDGRQSQGGACRAASSSTVLFLEAPLLCTFVCPVCAFWQRIHEAVHLFGAQWQPGPPELLGPVQAPQT